LVAYWTLRDEESAEARPSAASMSVTLFTSA
jgi:hypothetical protein